MDYLLLQWSRTSWTQLGSYAASIGIICGGVLPYIPQYREIHLSQNAEGFSTYVCLTLLLANTLRIMFWFGHHFEIPLLIQSVVMNIAMIAMIELCVRVKNRNLLVPNKSRYFIDNLSSQTITELNNDKSCMKSKPLDQMQTNADAKSSTNSPITPESPDCPTSGNVFVIDLNTDTNGQNKNSCHLQPKRFLDLDTRYFWQWTDFISYIEFLATFTVCAGIVMYLFVDYPLFVESVGFLSVLIEALLGTPQLIKNHKNKSTIGMSKLMVLFWTMGDVFKTVYFLLRSAPFQFWLCGILQVSIDLLILLQTIIYRKVYKKIAKEYIK